MMPGMRRVRSISPLLLVRDLQASVAFYCDVLGFEDPSFAGDPPTFCMLNRDGHDVMLQQARSADDVRPNARAGSWDMYLRVTDVAAEQHAVERAGATLAKGPRDAVYGMREIEVDDPDGYRTCLGQELP